MVHVCTLDKNGTCVDPIRDWCTPCGCCTVWAGEFCTSCGAEWGVSE